MTGPPRRRVVVPDPVRERRHGTGRRVGEPIIEAGSVPRRIIAWNRSRRRRAAARTGTGTAFSMIATVIASSRVRWARRNRPPGAAARARRRCGIQPDQASSSWTSQGSIERARRRKTSSRSPRRMRRTVCRPQPVRRTIRSIGAPSSASVLTAAFISARRRKPSCWSRSAEVRNSGFPSRVSRGPRRAHAVFLSSTAAQRRGRPGSRFHQASAIGDLDRFRRRAGDRLAPAAAAVARDNLDLGGDPPARPRRWRPRGRAECPRSRAARDRRQCRHSDARAAAPRRQCRSRAALAASPAPAPGRSAATYACSPASADGREAPARDGGGCSAVAVLQARQAAGVGGEDVFAEPFREDHSGAVAGRAPEPPHGERDPEAPSVRRQVRNGPHVATMDPARVYATVRAPRPCLARARNRRNRATTHLSLIHGQTRRR